MFKAPSSPAGPWYPSTYGSQCPASPMRFERNNCGKRARHDWAHLRFLAQRGTPLHQLSRKFNVSYATLRSISSREKWGIARIFGWKHRNRAGAVPPPLGQKPADLASEATPPTQTIPLPDAPSWHREFDHKWLTELRANERALANRHTPTPYASGYAPTGY